MVILDIDPPYLVTLAWGGGGAEELEGCDAVYLTNHSTITLVVVTDFLLHLLPPAWCVTSSTPIMHFPAAGQVPSPSNQGLTLVHIPAQLKRFLWDRGCM